MHNDTEYLRSSKANEARLNAAIEELNAGRGTRTNITKLRVVVRESPRR